MNRLDDLPELIIIQILKYTLLSHTKRRALPYLAICHRWRHLGVPIVYRELFIEQKYIITNDGAAHNNLTTNRELLANSYSQYVKTLRIEHLDNQTGLVNTLKELLDILDSKGEVGWPKNYKTKLLGVSARSAVYNPQMLNDELLGIVTKIITNCAKGFPYISNLDIQIHNSCAINGQFASKLIETFSGQLKSLKCHVNAPLTLEKFPESLNRLEYHCHFTCSPPMPRINPTSIKHLNLVSIPNEFQWQQRKMNFPNLTYLSLSEASSYDKRYRAEYFQERIVDTGQIYAPRLKTLVGNYMDAKFNHIYPSTVTHHLDTTRYSTTLNSLHQFSQLPIKSIGHLDVMLADPDIKDWSKFYQTTNRLFGEDLCEAARLNLRFLGPLSVDFKRTQWTSIKELVLFCASTQTILEIVEQMPWLEKLSISALINGTKDIVSQVDTKLKVLNVYYFDVEPTEQPRLFDGLLKVLLSLENLERVETFD